MDLVGKAGRVWLFGCFLTLPQRPRQCPLDRQGSCSRFHPASPHFADIRPQHELSRLRAPGLDGSMSSKIAVSRSLSFPLVFSFSPASPSTLFVAQSQFSLSGLFVGEASSGFSEANDELLDCTVQMSDCV